MSKLEKLLKRFNKLEKTPYEEFMDFMSVQRDCFDKSIVYNSSIIKTKKTEAGKYLEDGDEFYFVLLFEKKEKTKESIDISMVEFLMKLIALLEEEFHIYMLNPDLARRGIVLDYSDLTYTLDRKKMLESCGKVPHLIYSKTEEDLLKEPSYQYFLNIKKNFKKNKHMINLEPPDLSLKNIKYGLVVIDPREEGEEKTILHFF